MLSKLIIYTYLLFLHLFPSFIFLFVNILKFILQTHNNYEIKFNNVLDMYRTILFQCQRHNVYILNIVGIIKDNNLSIYYYFLRTFLLIKHNYDYHFEYIDSLLFIRILSIILICNKKDVLMLNKQL